MSASANGAPEPARPYIGGQALLEGVMMRSPHSFAIVCRRRSGELYVRERPIADERKGARALPLLRGMFTLVESLKLGSEALRYSAALYEQDLAAEEEAEAAAKSGKSGAAGPGVSSLWLSVTAAARALGASMGRALAALSLPVVQLSTMAPDGGTPVHVEPKDKGSPIAQALTIVFALGLFVAAPQGAANLINKVFDLGLDIRSAAFQAITGVMKLTIVISYLAAIRNVPDIRRVFQYHGAEHKTISTYEAEEALSVGNARSKTTLHPRCGTTFLVMVAMVSVIIFSAISPFLPRIEGVGTVGENVALFFMKLPFIPVIAAVTFEIQRIFARYCTTGPLRVLLWPGFLVQKITTIEPDDQQLEVALASLRATLWREDAAEKAPEAVTEKRFESYEALSTDRGYAL